MPRSSRGRPTLRSDSPAGRRRRRLAAAEALVLLAVEGAFFAGADFFFRAAADPAARAAGFAFVRRVALIVRAGLPAGFLRFAEPFALRAFTPSRECRMIVFRFELAAFRAGLRVDFFMVVSPSPGS